MKMDLKLLSQHFSQAPEGPSVSAEGVNPYLLEHVLEPYLRGEKVRYGDIDYEAFEDIELRAFSEYCENLYDAAYKLEQFTGTLANTRPEARRLQTFC